MSQSVKQCITVDLFPHILANVIDIQKVHLLLHTPLLKKTPRLSSERMFVRLYRLLLIHCIYVSVTKPTCPAFSAWNNTGAIRSMKVTGKAINSHQFFLPNQNLAKSHHLSSGAKDSKPLNYTTTDIREQNIYNYAKRNICHHDEKNGQS